jgi:hypothetical protein
MEHIDLLALPPLFRNDPKLKPFLDEIARLRLERQILETKLGIHAEPKILNDETREAVEAAMSNVNRVAAEEEERRAVAMSNVNKVAAEEDARRARSRFSSFFTRKTAKGGKRAAKKLSRQRYKRSRRKRQRKTQRKRK